MFFVEENGKHYFEIENIAYDNVLIHSIFDKYKNKNFAEDNLILSSSQKIKIPYPKQIKMFKEFFCTIYRPLSPLYMIKTYYVQGAKRNFF